MIKKICFKCSVEKDITEFYTHKKTADGYLNKCKLCTKNDTKKRIEELLKDETWKEKENERQREKYYRLGYKEKHKTSNEKKRKALNCYRDKYPEKYKAKIATQRLTKKDNHHLHHWSYNEEHFVDVIELYYRDHALLHRFIIYDQERKMYRNCKTLELLDTKQSHINLLNILKNNGNII